MGNSLHSMTQTNLQDKAQIHYFRADPLSVSDHRDLEAYANMLRTYYDIPPGQPVFPKRRAAPSPKRPARRVRATGVNRPDHPWRGTL